MLFTQTQRKVFLAIAVSLISLGLFGSPVWVWANPVAEEVETHAAPASESEAPPQVEASEAAVPSAEGLDQEAFGNVLEYYSYSGCYRVRRCGPYGCRVITVCN